MNIKITHPQADMYGNEKENIFLAFDENADFVGSAYIFPRVHVHQTRQTPYLLYMDISATDAMIQELLFEKVFERAKVLRTYHPELVTWLYTGFAHNVEKESFYLKHGFVNQYSLIMECPLQPEVAHFQLDDLVSNELELTTEAAFNDYKAIYDENFITPCTFAYYEDLKKKVNFKNIVFYQDQKFVGGYLVYQNDDCGYIETLFVKDSFRNQGYGKKLLSHAMQYFNSIQLTKVQLEFWELNQDARSFYESFGFKKIRNNDMFPGMELVNIPNINETPAHD